MSSSPGARDKAQELYERGYQLTLSGEYDAALAAYSRAIEQDPKLAPAHFGRGICHHQLGRTDQARQDMQTAAALGSTDARTYLGQLTVHDSPPGAERRQQETPFGPFPGKKRGRSGFPVKLLLTILVAAVLGLFLFTVLLPRPEGDPALQTALSSEDLQQVAQAARQLRDSEKLRQVARHCEQMAVAIVAKHSPPLSPTENLRLGAWLALAEELESRAQHLSSKR